nr:putative reverse transcriptase, RNA-dependent DNA polymerase, Gag-polypeptide of LTR copia-type [Tanacetum cinerariifolium]
MSDGPASYNGKKNGYQELLQSGNTMMVVEHLEKGGGLLLPSVDSWLVSYWTLNCVFALDRSSLSGLETWELSLTQFSSLSLCFILFLICILPGCCSICIIMSGHGYTGDDYVTLFELESVTSISKLGLSDPLHLHPNDSATLTIISVKLKGTENYQIWFCAMMLALEGKNKTGFINGSCRRSNVNEELFLGQNFSKRAKHVWDELKETYDKVDGSVTFNLHHKINSLCQNSSTLADYYHNLNAPWKLFDALVQLPKCTCHAAEDFKRHNQLMKLMQFLMGLDNSYIQIRSNIMSRDPLPNVRGAYAIISSEESHRVVFSSNSGASQRSQSSMFNSAVGNFRAVVIVNSCANQHLTYIDKLLVNVIDISKHRIKVSHPNGTKAVITKVGNMILNKNLTLYDVMVVPEYRVSLMSDHKVARDSGLIVAFNENKCFVLPQDLKGMLPSPVLNGKSPFDLVFNMKPVLKHLRVFGCLCFATVLNGHDKFGSRVEKCVLVGYASFKKRYKLFSLERKQFVYSRDVKFFEKDKEVATSAEHNAVPGGDNVDYESVPTTTLPPIRRSEWTSNFPSKYNEFIVESKVKYSLKIFVSYVNLSSQNKCFSTELNKSFEPKTFYEASKVQHWIEAMNNEMDALYRNDTWEIIDLPISRKAIGGKWVYKIKYKSSGDIDRYKARYVAKGLIKRKSLNGNFIALLVYVDDIIITGNNSSEIEKFKAFLNTKFMIKDLGMLKYFLVIEVINTENSLCLSQRKDCLDLLTEFGMLACKPSVTPLEQNLSMTNEPTISDPVLDNVTEYQKLIDDFKRHNQLMKLMRFLMGFDNSYIQIRSSILSRDPLPDVRGAYVIISSEECNAQRYQTSGNTSRHSNVTRPPGNVNRRTNGGPQLVCEICGFNGHTGDRCFKLIGYPIDFGKRNNNNNKGVQNFNRRFTNNNSVGSSQASTFFDDQLYKTSTSF